MIEVWKKHPTLGIMVSDKGRVETERKGKYFGCNAGCGYKQVWWKGRNYYIHILVYETFIGEIPEGYDVNHIDEDKTNNRVDNLNLMTRKENINWGTHNERSAKSRSKAVSQYTKDGRFVNEWESTIDAQRLGGFHSGHISECCNGKLKSHGGFIWRYKKIA